MLSQQERDQLGNKLTELALIYSVDFPKQKASMYISTMEKYFPHSFDQYILAIDRYVNDSKNKFFPSILNIKSYLNPTASPEAISNEVASRIRKAIGDFGWCNPAPAKAYIGELGWKVVERMGGWSYICENHGVDLNPLTIHAQMRDLTKSMLETSALGEFDQPIPLPDSQNNVRQLINKTVKEIPK